MPDQDRTKPTIDDISGTLRSQVRAVWTPVMIVRNPGGVCPPSQVDDDNFGAKFLGNQIDRGMERLPAVGSKRNIVHHEADCGRGRDDRDASDTQFKEFESRATIARSKSRRVPSISWRQGTFGNSPLAVSYVDNGHHQHNDVRLDPLHQRGNVDIEHFDTSSSER